jgi:hypothetical protein
MPRYDQKRFFPERAVGKWIPIVGPEEAPSSQYIRTLFFLLGRLYPERIEYRVVMRVMESIFLL